MKSVALTGVTGAIGMSMLKLLSEQDIKTLVFIHRGSPRNNNLDCFKNVEKVVCNLDELKEYKAKENFDIFINMAWVGGNIRYDVDTQLSNIQFALDTVRLAKRLGCKRYVGVGSQAEYGLVDSYLSSSTECNPVNPFGASKLYAGLMTRYLAHELGMDHIWTRVLSVYGPYDGSRTMISSLIQKLLKGEKPSLTFCEQIWDYIYSDDAANALYLVAEKGKNNKTYPIGSGEGRPLLDYVYDVRDSINKEAVLGIGDVPYKEDQSMFLCADIRELYEDTGFRPMTSFKDGIKKTVEWVKLSNL